MSEGEINEAEAGRVRRSPALWMMLPALLVGLLGVRWGLPDEAHDLYFTTSDSLTGAVRTMREAGESGEALPRSAYNPLRSYHPDEYYLFKMLAGVRPGQFRFDPKWYVIGGAYLYPLGAWLKGAEMLRLITLDPRPEFYLEHPELMSRMYIAGRLLTVIAGALATFVIAHLAWRLMGTWPAVIAGLIVALSPIYAMNASFMYNDVPGMLWVSLCMLGTLSIMQNGRARDYLLCAVAAGLAAGTKIFDGLIILLPLAAHFLSARGDRRIMRLLMLPLVAAVVLLATNPYYILKADDVLANFRAHAVSGTSFGFYAKSLAFGFGAAPVLFAVGGWGIALIRRNRFMILTSAFPGAFFLLISLFGKQFARYVLPILPAIALMAAYFCTKVPSFNADPAKSDKTDALPTGSDQTRAKPDTIGHNRTFSRCLRAVIAGCIVVVPGAIAVCGILNLKAHLDTRTVAGRWLLENVEPGRSIAVTEVPWQFEMPPMDGHRWRIEVTGYDARRLAESDCGFFVYSDLQSDPEVNPHPDVPAEAAFWQSVESGRNAERFDMAFEGRPHVAWLKLLPALGLWKKAPEDMRYVSPHIRVRKRQGPPERDGPAGP